MTDFPTDFFRDLWIFQREYRFCAPMTLWLQHSAFCPKNVPSNRKQPAEVCVRQYTENWRIRDSNVIFQFLPGDAALHSAGGHTLNGDLLPIRLLFRPGPQALTKLELGPQGSDRSVFPSAGKTHKSGNADVFGSTVLTRTIPYPQLSFSNYSTNCPIWKSLLWRYFLKILWIHNFLASPM